MILFGHALWASHNGHQQARVEQAFRDPPRVVEGHGIGTVCRPDDPDAIARAVAWTLDDPGRNAGLRAAARAAAGELTWEREAPVLVELVGRLAAER